MIELISNTATAGDYLVTRDLRDTDEARRLSQELVVKFGELVEAWPAP